MQSYQIDYINGESFDIHISPRLTIKSLLGKITQKIGIHSRFQILLHTSHANPLTNNLFLSQFNNNTFTLIIKTHLVIQSNRKYDYKIVTRCPKPVIPSIKKTQLVGFINQNQPVKIIQINQNGFAQLHESEYKRVCDSNKNKLFKVFGGESCNYQPETEGWIRLD